MQHPRRRPRSFVCRTLVAALLACFGLQAAPAPAADGSPSSAVYTLDLRWTPKPASLSGRESIAFTNTSTQPLTTVWLRIWPNGYGGCRQPNVVLDQVAGATAGTPAADCTALPLVLDSAVAPGATGSVSFHFAGTVPKGPSRYGLVRRTALLGTAIPVLAVTDSSGLHLEPNAPLGESMYSLAAAWNVRLTIPASLEAATTGWSTASTDLPDGTRQLEIHADAARDFAMAIGPFTVHSAMVGGTSLRYFEPSRPRIPRTTVLDWASSSFEDFSTTVGPYTSPELDIVGLRRLLGDGIEYPELVFTELVEETVSHEVAHQWFYSMAGNNQAVEPWLDESFTEFLSMRHWGENLTCDVDHPFAGMGDEPLDSPMSLFEEGIGFHYYAVMYGGGPCVLERLRRDWGDPLFDAFLAAWFETHRDRVATTVEFKAAVRTWAPAGYDVDSFFAQARLTTWPD